MIVFHVVNNVSLVKNFSSLDYNDIAILSTIEELLNLNEIERYEIDGNMWFNLPYNLLMEELPNLKIKTKMGMFKRLNKLVEVGLLKRCPKSKELNLSLYYFGEKYPLYKHQN